MTGELHLLQHLAELDESNACLSYQQLVEEYGADHSMSEESSMNEEYDRRKSVGCFLSGRNSISNWTTFNQEESMEDVPVPEIEQREVRVSSLETPVIRDYSGVNISSRNSRVNSRQRSSDQRDNSGLGASEQQNNLSHISSSSSSLGESWSPIRSGVERSYKKNGDATIPKKRLSQSFLRGLSTSKSRSKSPMKSPGRSPIRSPLGDLSPNRSRAQSPKKSQMKSVATETKHTLRALSPNGAFSLKEAEPSVLDKEVKVPSKSKFILPSLGRKELPTPQKLRGNHIRSPVPTPNSQRRVIKRLRASLPTANFQNKVREEGLQVATKTVERRNSSATITALKSEKAPPMTYENKFEFPSMSGPLNATLTLFKQDAIAQGSSSQQYQLSAAGSDLISMHEVILPAVAYDTNAILKKFQSKAQRSVQDGMPDSQGKNVVDVIETCRKVVSKCSAHAAEVAGKLWRERQEKRQQSYLEHHAREMKEQKHRRAQAKLQRKEQHALAKQQRYDRLKYEKQKSYPRNKEMWQEVAKLMMDIQKLEKEERLWNEALSEVSAMEKNFQPPEKMDLASLDDVNPRVAEQEKLCNAIVAADLNSTSTTMIQDVTIATERISWMLQSVSLAVEESDRLRTEAYQKYQYEGHKYHGYQTGNSKQLFVALSMDDSFA